jgi:hypothetical protein
MVTDTWPLRTGCCIVKAVTLEEESGRMDGFSDLEGLQEWEDTNATAAAKKRFRLGKARYRHVMGGSLYAVYLPT